jgi:hypothetical protein
VKIALRPGESVIREAPANLQRGIETVGGRLSLTTTRLVFEAHALNVQRGATEIELSAVKSANPCWTRFLGLIPLVPNSLAVTTKDGTEYRFVLFKRAAWRNDIEAASAAQDRPPPRDVQQAL